VNSAGYAGNGNTGICIALCCSVVQRVAVLCSALQHVKSAEYARNGNTGVCVAVFCRALQCIAVCCSV